MVHSLQDENMRIADVTWDHVGDNLASAVCQNFVAIGQTTHEHVHGRWSVTLKNQIGMRFYLRDSFSDLRQDLPFGVGESAVACKLFDKRI